MFSLPLFSYPLRIEKKILSFLTIIINLITISLFLSALAVGKGAKPSSCSKRKSIDFLIKTGYPNLIERVRKVNSFLG